MNNSEYALDRILNWLSPGSAAHRKEEAKQALKQLMLNTRIDEANKSKQIATNNFDKSGFTIVDIFSARIVELEAQKEKTHE